MDKPVKICDRKGCNQPSLMQSIGGLCGPHQEEIWKILLAKIRKDRAIAVLTGTYRNSETTPTDQ